MPTIGPETAFAQQLHRDKYRSDGESFDDYTVRYARTTADDTPHFRHLLDALRHQRLLPGGRQQLDVGRGYLTTAMSCFTGGNMDDSLDGIMSELRDSMMTLRSGGGCGWNFSTLRPEHDPVRGLGPGASASGPVSFMGLWNAGCSTIMSAGMRRGAMMGVLNVNHPDVFKFVRAKRNDSALTNFNVSVGVSERFMEAVYADGLFPLEFGGRVYNEIRALDLWAVVMESNWDWAEPGVLFLDTINRLNPLAYCEKIYACNPCVTGDTWVLTAQGAARAADLQGRPADLVVDGEVWPSDGRGFFQTGRKPVVRLRTAEGHTVRLTADHRVLAAADVTRYGVATRWVEAGSLRAGDHVVLHDHRRLPPTWDGDGTEDEGYLLGLLVGDGHIKDDEAVLSSYGHSAGVLSCRALAEVAARSSFRSRSDFAGWFAVAGHDEARMKPAGLFRLAGRFGLCRGGKTVTPEMESASGAFYVGLLRGLFDADGTVTKDPDHGITARLSQSDLPLLGAVQRMLLRLGIVSRIYTGRHAAGERLLPDGKGGLAPYHCREAHELVVSRENVARFAVLVGFGDEDKQCALENGLGEYRRRPAREQFLAVVTEVTPDGEDDVYDVCVPGMHAFDANGLYVHNCAEEPLPPHGACLLGSLCLVKYLVPTYLRLDREVLKNGHVGGAGRYVRGYELDLDLFRADVAAAVRAFDNVIDRTTYPLPRQKAEAAAKRRMGLGVTGAANALEVMGTPYGTDAYLAAQDAVLEVLRDAAYRASIDLAREKGAFPLFDADQWLASGYAQTLPDDIRDGVRRHGLRNGILLSLAPTGTISLTADNCSSGIEPVACHEQERDVFLPDGKRTVRLLDYAYLKYNHRGRLARDVSPAEHVRVLCRAQHYVDSAVSKTINLRGARGSDPGPGETSFADFKDVYAQAHRGGAKGCTTFNENGRRAGILREAVPAGAACTTDPVTLQKTCG